jgi:hypothetical protein
MKISMHGMALDTFVPMLTSLSEVLDKGEAHARAGKLDLVDARLAPDMHTLAQQIQRACHWARDGMTRLAGQPAAALEDEEKTFGSLKAQIDRTIAFVRDVPAALFDGADERDCSIGLPDDKIIAMDGLRFLKAWALPHFYFHVVTAYDILRHNGVGIGKRDYLSQVGGLIQPRE